MSIHQLHGLKVVPNNPVQIIDGMSIDLREGIKVLDINRLKRIWEALNSLNTQEVNFIFDILEIAPGIDNVPEIKYGLIKANLTAYIEKKQRTLEQIKAYLV